MSGIDVAALLESTEKPETPVDVIRLPEEEIRSHRSGSPIPDRISHRRARRDSRERSRTPDRRHYRERDRRYRSRRSRSPDHWRPSGRRSRDDRRERLSRSRTRSRSPERDRERRRRRRTPSPSPAPEGDRDARTIFVQQLAARLRTKQLREFFERAGPVVEAQIVKDRVSGRSKGVGYVEFKTGESVPAAIAMTGQQLLNIPIIAQQTDAEKNRIPRPAGGSGTTGVPPNQLLLNNVHFSVGEEELKSVFEPFGEVEVLHLEKQDGRSRGFGFVRFKEAGPAKKALEECNGLDIANRPMRVSAGTERQHAQFNTTTPSDTPAPPVAQGSAYFGAGGRGRDDGFGGSRPRNDKPTWNASALDDTDTMGFNNYSRDKLMRALARTEDPAKPAVAPKPKILRAQNVGRCVCLRNVFDTEHERAENGPNWMQDLEAEVRDECNLKYGKVVHLGADPNSDGDVYVKFEKISGSENAMNGLNGRKFGGRTIRVNYVADAIYHAHFPKAQKF